MVKKNNPHGSEWIWELCTTLGKLAVERRSLPIGYGHALATAQREIDMKTTHGIPISTPALSRNPNTPFIKTDFLAALQVVGAPRPSSRDDPEAIVIRVGYCEEVYDFCLSYFNEAGNGVYTKFITDYETWWEDQRELHDE